MSWKIEKCLSEQGSKLQCGEFKMVGACFLDRRWSVESTFFHFIGHRFEFQIHQPLWGRRHFAVPRLVTTSGPLRLILCRPKIQPCGFRSSSTKWMSCNEWGIFLTLQSFQIWKDKRIPQLSLFPETVFGRSWSLFKVVRWVWVWYFRLPSWGSRQSLIDWLNAYVIVDSCCLLSFIFLHFT